VADRVGDDGVGVSAPISYCPRFLRSTASSMTGMEPTNSPRRLSQRFVMSWEYSLARCWSSSTIDVRKGATCSQIHTSNQPTYIKENFKPINKLTKQNIQLHINGCFPKQASSFRTDKLNNIATTRIGGLDTQVAMSTNTKRTICSILALDAGCLNRIVNFINAFRTKHLVVLSLL
jgi:hypothetical protein